MADLRILFPKSKGLTRWQCKAANNEILSGCETMEAKADVVHNLELTIAAGLNCSDVDAARLIAQWLASQPGHVLITPLTPDAASLALAESINTAANAGAEAPSS
jgi:S-methylmethionine-dependent homocysteine/selenocysteine methylase